MYFEEFLEKVGTIGLLVDENEYDKIYREYAESDLHKDEFLANWKAAKIQAALKISSTTAE